MLRRMRCELDPLRETPQGVPVRDHSRVLIVEVHAAGEEVEVERWQKRAPLDLAVALGFQQVKVDRRARGHAPWRCT